MPIFKNTVILKQLGLTVGIPFGLVALVIVLVLGRTVIRCMRSGSLPGCLPPDMALYHGGLPRQIRGGVRTGRALDFFGEPATAVVTHIRREGGERTDAVLGRYTYDISYTFTLPNGSKVEGFTKKVGDAVYLRPMVQAGLL